MKQLMVPRNWADFQHYKDRRPPWIKLHKSLLDDRVYMRLPLASKALAPLLWLLASESETGEFDASVDELEFRLRMSAKDIESGLRPLIDNGFFCLASSVLAGCLQLAVPEERRGETETEAEVNKPPKTKLPKCPHELVIGIYHELLPELPAVRVTGKKRKEAIQEFWDWVLTDKRLDGTLRATSSDGALAYIRDYCNVARGNDWLMGRTPRSGEHANWRCDIEFLFSEKGRIQVIEKTEAAHA